MIEKRDSLPVRHLFSIELEVGGSADTATGPQGRRMIVPVTGGRFEGERLRGRVVSPSGDWMTVREGGSMKLDVRLTLETEDGVAIHMWYDGIVTIVDGVARARSAPLFETGGERYQWLNDVQAVGVGEVEGTTVRYQVYELL